MKIYDSAVKQTPVISQIKAIYESRDLLRLLVNRDLTVRYKRSVIGVWWSLLNPILTAVVLFYVFNTAFKSHMPGSTAFAPYLLSGVLLLTFFNQGLTMGANSIVASSELLKKIYVSPEIFVFSASISSAINFCIGLLPLSVVLIISGKHPGYMAVLVLVVIFCMVLLTTGLAMLLAIAYINFDDSRSIIGILLLMLQYMTPVFYPISVLGPHTQAVIKLNPLTSYLTVFRKVFGDNGTADWNAWAFMVISSLTIFIIGFTVFARKWPKAVAKL